MLVPDLVKSRHQVVSLCLRHSASRSLGVRTLADTFSRPPSDHLREYWQARRCDCVGEFRGWVAATYDASNGVIIVCALFSIWMKAEVRYCERHAEGELVRAPINECLLVIELLRCSEEGCAWSAQEVA